MLAPGGSLGSNFFRHLGAVFVPLGFYAHIFIEKHERCSTQLGWLSNKYRGFQALACKTAVLAEASAKTEVSKPLCYWGTGEKNRRRPGIGLPVQLMDAASKSGGFEVAWDFLIRHKRR
jgi:hypothetical protein